MTIPKALLGVLGMALLCPGFSHGGPKSWDVTGSLPACARRGPARITPLEGGRAGSTVVLARFGDQTVAYVADEDDRNVHAFDVDAQRELSTTPTKGIPSQLLVTKDGRLLVALRDQAQVEVLEPDASVGAPLASRCTVGTPDEPLALALTPDDKTLLVSSGWGHELTVYDTETLARKYTRPLAREPRSVIVSDDGARAFVAHAVGGKMSVVDLEGDAHAVGTLDLGEKGDLAAPARVALVPRSREFDDEGNRKKSKPVLEATPRAACQGFALAKSVEPAGRILAPEVLVDTGDPTLRSAGYGNAEHLPTEIAAIGVIDVATLAGATPASPTRDQDRAVLTSSLTVQALPDAAADPMGGDGDHDCLLPRAAAIDPLQSVLLVACLGIDAVVAYDASSAKPASAEVHRWDVGSGPTGIAVDAKKRRAIAWSQFDKTVTVLQLGGDRPSAKIPDDLPSQVALSRQAAAPTTQDVALGRKLFHSRAAGDGRACASCHPDGRDDGLTWTSPDGPRQTPSLAGRLEGTAPYAWVGSGPTVEAHVESTFSRLQSQLPPRRALEALVAYATTMSPPARATTSGSPMRLARGREIFHTEEAGCSSCHGVDGQRPDGISHDVGSRGLLETESAFNTPSLRFVGGTSPYLHDGKYGTLRELLAATDGKMGQTSHLSNDDLNALETYLRSL